MDSDLIGGYWDVREGGGGFYEQNRGLIAVWGKEAIQFLDGLITNNVKKLADGDQMLAAFPNAQGRLLALVRVRRDGERFLFETEEETTDKVFQNLFKFTFAGDFFVENLTEQYRYFEIFGPPVAIPETEPFRTVAFDLPPWPQSVFVPIESGSAFAAEVGNPVSDEVYETLRIERGIPKYGVDMDPTTIVPELGLDGLISYNKGCYIGQEIIARIHFRGHVAKKLTGLAFNPTRTPSSAKSANLSPEEMAIADEGVRVPAELTTPEGKNAGRILSSTFSPQFNRTIALSFVRYDYLATGTTLVAGDTTVEVCELPFIK